jgi:spore germination protein YaaH
MQRLKHCVLALILVSAVSGITGVSASSSASAAAARNATAQVTHGLQREVFGFALAGSLNDSTVGYPSWNFSLLSTVAFFGLHINDDGTIAADSGWTVWTSDQLTNLVNAAHAHGAKVVVTIIEQDFGAGTPHMCAALANRATTVSQTAAQVSAKNVDGVNIDFEGLNGTCPNGQTTRSMVTDLAHRLRAALPVGSYLSVDTYASSAADPYGFFDIPGLNAYVDAFFVMAYDLENSNYARPPTSCTSFCLGPTAPLSGYYYNDTTTAAQYTAAVTASKVILGVPYYGRKACVASAAPNQYPIGPVGVDTYLDAAAESSAPQVQPGSFVAHRDSNDPAGQERWDTWINTTLGCTRELYWDDAVSLGKKYDLVNSDGLRGVGIWNLNYGGGAPELWTALHDHFAACTSAGLTAAAGPPQPRGATIQLTATSAGCASPQYAFWLQYQSGTWVLQQAFSPSPTWSWDTSKYPTGAYTVHVWANQSGGDMTMWQSYGEVKYSLSVPPPCASATLSPSSASQPAGSTVVLTAGSTGCPNPRYQFWVQYPNGTWSLAQGWGGATFNWSTTGLAPGVYTVHMWANQAGDSMASWEAYGSSSVALSVCTSAALAPTNPSAAAGTAVNLTASSTGCANPQYELWVQYPNGSWNLSRVWGGAAVSWSTAGLGPGTYNLHVWANNQGDPMVSWEAYGSDTVTLNGCTSASLAPPSGSATVGTKVTFTASSSGCPSPLYAFWLQDPGGTWHVMQTFNAGGATWQWNSAGWPKGNYVIHVWANNQGADTSTWEAYGTSTFILS